MYTPAHTHTHTQTHTHTHTHNADKQSKKHELQQMPTRISINSHYNRHMSQNF